MCGWLQRGREGVEEEWEQTDEFHERWKTAARDVLAKAAFRHRKLTKRVSGVCGGGCGTRGYGSVTCSAVQEVLEVLGLTRGRTGCTKERLSMSLLGSTCIVFACSHAVSCLRVLPSLSTGFRTTFLSSQIQPACNPAHQQQNNPLVPPLLPCHAAVEGRDGAAQGAGIRGA